MPRANVAALRPSNISSSRFAMVAVGIALFAVGFAITIASSSSAGDVSEGSRLVQDSSSGWSLDLMTLSGMTISIAGVVTATVGPVVSFVKRK